MPIRFRCAYCNQLMGIARRKAGQVVRCPTCAGEIVVPQADAEPSEAEAPARQSVPALFEKSDFDQNLFGSRPSIHLEAVHKEEYRPAVPASAPPPPAIMPPTTAPPGIVVTPMVATVLAVLFVLLLGVAFFAGILVGRS